MNTLKLLIRNLKYYRKAHLWVALGTMLSTSILVGALVIGDSVKFSLRQIVIDRLGETEFALQSGDRFFRTQLAGDLSGLLDTAVAPLLQTAGIAISEGGERRANNIQILGVDGRFGELGGVADFYRDISPDEAIINVHLAARLRVKKGDEILIRIKKSDIIPKDMPLSLDSDLTTARRFRIKDIASDSRFGRFNLKAEQIAPHTIFISLSRLAKEMGIAGRANVLLVAKNRNKQKFLRQITHAFKKAWKLTDAGLEVTELPGRGLIELKSRRIFLDSPVVDAAKKIDKRAQLILTYFVNGISLGDRSTPYSFAAAPGAPTTPAGMLDNEIIINEWVARDIGATKGDQIRLTYYILGSQRNLVEESRTFRVKKVVPMQAPYVDRDLLPDFPGLSGKQDCRDWRPGIPIDLDKIRQKDEDYWDAYRGSPKAFVTLQAAQKMWRNRFGDLTAIRFSGVRKQEIETKLTAAIDPAKFGFIFRNVKEEGLRAGSQSVDFAQLFLGLSFFIIVAALFLTGLLYVFNAEQRSRESGLFLALGFRRKDVKRLALLEGAVIIFFGSVLGGAAGIFYNQVLLVALKTVWHDVVGTSALHIHLKFFTILTGITAGIILAFFAILLMAGKQFKQPIISLQKGLTKLETSGNSKPRLSMLLGFGALSIVIAILALTKFETGRGAFMFFFTAGILLLVSGMAFIKILLYKIRLKANTIKLSLFNIGVRNNVRKPVRSLTLIGLLACGLFIVFTVGANRNTAAQGPGKRESGTGGFALFAESAIPVLYDLNKPKGSSFYGLEAINEQGVSYVQFRVKEGDDASCLNLNRTSNPQLLGVEPGELSRRGSFTFVKRTPEIDPENPWPVLDRILPGGIIPGVADQTVILWGLGKAVGDTLTYTDERGRKFKIKLVGGLANSIFQGNIIISEKALKKKYPSLSGYRLFLVDVPSKEPAGPPEAIAKELSWAMQDQGLDVLPAAARLAGFSRVENTYLSIFLILGSFGLLLGSIGLGIVVWRNVKERQGELALLRAVGFSKNSIQKMVLTEHITLLAAGIFCGIAAALLATLPAITAPGSGIPYFTILFLLLIVMLNGFAWIYTATHMATRGNLLTALRNE
jgi:putative ABC transport system permease protein